MCLIPELQYLLSIYDSPHATWVGETSVDEIRFFSISSSGHQPRPSRGSKIHKLYESFKDLSISNRAFYLSISGFCNETTGRVRKSKNRKLNNRFQDITVRFIFNILIDLKLTSRHQVPP